VKRFCRSFISSPVTYIALMLDFYAENIFLFKVFDKNSLYLPYKLQNIPLIPYYNLTPCLCFNYSSIALFADDTNLHVSDSNMRNIKETIIQIYARLKTGVYRTKRF
jgi:hypothetical protein